jgi:pyruvate dehydrogenase E2 component (dihydrolipoamide acetyltransferase)
MTDRLVPAALLLKAAAVAARQVPQHNGFWADDHFSAADAVHLGVAIYCAAAVSSHQRSITPPTCQ